MKVDQSGEKISKNSALAGGLTALQSAVFLFGLAGLFGKWVSAGPLMIVFGRVFFASLSLAGMLRLFHSPFRLPKGRALVEVAACGLLLVIHWGAFFHSIQISTVAVGLLAFATAPVFTALLEPGWNREPFSKKSLLASLIALAGVVLIVPEWRLADSTLRGLGWGIGAGFSFALLTLLNRSLRSRHGSMEVAFFQDLIASLLLIPFLPVFWIWPGWDDILLLLVLGVFCTALAHGLFIYALKGITARLATLTGNLEPVYGITLAWLFLGEIPAPRTILGGIIILAAICWITFSPSRSAR